MDKKLAKRAFLSQWSLFSSSKTTLLNKLEVQIANSRKTTYIFTPNPEQLVLSHSDPDFAATLSQADFLLPDGVGLIWGARLLASRGLMSVPQERLTGIDIATELLTLARAHDWPVAILGGRGYQAALASRWPDQSVVWHPGYQQVAQPTADEETAVQAWLAATKPTILFVAFGAPWQEQWAVAHRQLLEKSGVKLVMVVGGAFDVLLGQVPRAPGAVRRLGLEWLFRLLRQPWRWRRQLKLLTFIRLVGLEYYSGS